MIIKEINLTDVVEEIKKELIEYIDQKFDEYFKKLNNDDLTHQEKIDQFEQFVEDQSYELSKAIDDLISNSISTESSTNQDINLKRLEKTLSESNCVDEGGDKIGKYLQIDKEREEFGEINIDSLQYNISNNLNFEELSKYVIIPKGHTFKTLTTIIPIVVKKTKYNYSVVFGHEFVNLAKRLGVEFLTVLCLNDETNIDYTINTLKSVHKNLNNLLTLSL
ncbi:MAG: hypothetical protein QXW48_01430 [Thermoplasmata archaeon]